MVSRGHNSSMTTSTGIGASGTRRVALPSPEPSNIRSTVRYDSPYGGCPWWEGSPTGTRHSDEPNNPVWRPRSYTGCNNSGLLLRGLLTCVLTSYAISRGSGTDASRAVTSSGAVSVGSSQ